jgi:hypothetical protein
MKDTFYFPHDNDASKDPKISAMINDFGIASYGLYWLIIELLHKEGGKIQKFPKLYSGLAFQFGIGEEELKKHIEAMLHDYNLLEQDDAHIWSNRVLKNLDERKLKYQIKAEAGRIGGLKSGISRNITKQNEAMLEANEQKERKGKEIKGKESKEESETSSPIQLEVLLEPHKSKYGETLISAFLNYWTQKNPNGKKELWQMQRVFDVPKRLATWASKDWNKPKKLIENIKI